MTVRTLDSAPARADFPALPIAAAFLLGLGLLFVAGHLQAGPLHAAAHDTRHANVFPCH